MKEKSKDEIWVKAAREQTRKKLASMKKTIAEAIKEQNKAKTCSNCNWGPGRWPANMDPCDSCSLDGDKWGPIEGKTND